MRFALLILAFALAGCPANRQANVAPLYNHVMRSDPAPAAAPQGVTCKTLNGFLYCD